MPLSLEEFLKVEVFWKELREKQPLFFSEYSAVNNYLFQNSHRYEVVQGCPPFIRGVFKDHSSFLIPSLAPPELVEYALHLPTPLFPIPEEWLSFFPERFFTRDFDPADSDYIFLKSQFVDLSGEGHRLGSRRNLLKQLMQQNSVVSLPFSDSQVPEALELLKKWRTQHPQQLGDYVACEEALQKWGTLGLFGRVLYVNDNFAGFALGQLLNSSVASLLFLKYDKFVKGITPFLYRDFSRHTPSSVEFINLQQDLGIPGLRQAKMAYQPFVLKNKWRLTSKKLKELHL